MLKILLATLLIAASLFACRSNPTPVTTVETAPSSPTAPSEASTSDTSTSNASMNDAPANQPAPANSTVPQLASFSAAHAFLDSLTADQRETAVLPLDSD